MPIFIPRLNSVGTFINYSLFLTLVSNKMDTQASQANKLLQTQTQTQNDPHESKGCLCASLHILLFTQNLQKKTFFLSACQTAVTATKKKRVSPGKMRQNFLFIVFGQQRCRTAQKHERYQAVATQKILDRRIILFLIL